MFWQFQFCLQSICCHGQGIGRGDALIVALDINHDGAVMEALAGGGGGEEGFVIGEVGRLGIIVTIRGEVGIDKVIGQ